MKLNTSSTQGNKEHGSYKAKKRFGDVKGMCVSVIKMKQKRKLMSSTGRLLCDLRCL